VANAPSTTAAPAASRRYVISDEHLRAAFVDDAMASYFGRKFPEVEPSELMVRICEALKFLFISSECRGSIPVTKDIDEIWHAWILQTQEYMQLCSLLPAGDYIHHCSNDYLAFFDDPSEATGDLADAVRMLALYVHHFGPFDPRRTRYWRYASHLVDRCGWSVDELNDWLLTPA
jgi:hypothetical protein